MFEPWSSYFVAVAGAAAALAGLLIVAVSVSVDKIIAGPGLPGRAGTSIAMLVLATIVALLGLIPDQTRSTFGSSVLILSLGGVVLALASLWSMMKAAVGSGERRVISAFVKGLLGIAPFVVFSVGAALVVGGPASGLYWMAHAIVLAIILASVNAWVLLVEIRR